MRMIRYDVGGMNGHTVMIEAENENEKIRNHRPNET